MLSFFDSLRGLSLGAVALRMGLSCLCGLLIGLNRSAKNRPAGFRTHILVCMASVLAAATGLYLFTELKLPSDISRISSQVISGLGFIGAGTIVVTKKMSVTGLTTAAGLWTTGIIGLAIGSGYYELALLGTALVVITEILFAPLGDRIQRQPEYKVQLVYGEKNSLDNVLRLCKDMRMNIISLRIQSLEEGITAKGEAKAARYTAEVTLRGSVDCNELLHVARQMPGIVSAIAE